MATRVRVSLLPTNSFDIEFLRNHDFGGSFSLEKMSNIDAFVIDWGVPEKSFLDSDLEQEKIKFWSLCNEFRSFVALKTAPKNGYQSAIPRRLDDNSYEWPDSVKKDVQDLNAKATEAFNAHQAFIALAKDRLQC